MNAVAVGALTSRLIADASRSIRPSRSGGVHRTGDPVRRGSLEEGTFEDGWYYRYTHAELDEKLMALKRSIPLAHKLRCENRSGERPLTVAERRIAKVTHKVVAVFEYLVNLARTYHGRVFPSYEDIVEKVGICRSNVAEIIALITGPEFGLVEKQRRFRMARVDDKPHYKQTSTAYRLAAKLPDFLKRCLPFSRRPAPTPADATHHAREQEAQTRRMIAGATCTQQAEYFVDADTPLGKQLHALGASLDRCESVKLTEPLLKSL